MSNSRITIDEVGVGSPDGWLPNVHAGEILASEFIVPLDLSPADLAASVGVGPDRIEDVVHGRSRMSAELDLRFARYFGMSEGFFLRLQDGYELLEAKRTLNGALDRIVPRAV